jgi:hypothetical protein
MKGKLRFTSIFCECSKAEVEELSASSQSELKQLQQTVAELQSELRAETQNQPNEHFLATKVCLTSALSD